MRGKLLLFLVLGLTIAASACDAFPLQESPTLDPPPGQARLQPQAASPGLVTHMVRRGSIAGEISLRGRVIAAQETPVFFKTNGWLKDLRVSLGDQVEQGTLIAEIESPDLEREVEDAGYRLNLARLRLSHEREAPFVDKVAIAREGVAQASIALERARLSLEKLMAPPTAEEVEAAKVAVERARNSLWASQEERDGIKGNGSSAQFQGGAADARVAVAENAVRTSLLDLEIKLKGPKPEDVALARNAVATAEANLAAAKTGLEYEIAITDLNLANKQLTLSTSQQEVTYRERLLRAANERAGETRVAAPFSGVVVSLDAKIGDSIKPFSPIGILADPSVLQMEANVPVELMDAIFPGLPVKITLDGFRDKVITGKVAIIADKATTWQGKSVHRVTIAFEQGVDVPPAMRIGADMTVLGRTKSNALLAPKASVSAEGDRRYVGLLVGGKEKRVEVKVGVSDSDWFEVISGVEENDLLAMPSAARTMQGG